MVFLWGGENVLNNANGSAHKFQVWSLCFMVAQSRTQPSVVAWANDLKTSADFAIVITLVGSLLMKLDLRNEVVSESVLGWLLVLTNVAIPGCVVLYHCLPMLLCNGGEQSAKKRIKEIFDMLDTDHSGSLNMEEATAFVVSTHGTHPGDFNQKKAEATFSKIDQDGNKKIDKSEWHNYITSICAPAHDLVCSTRHTARVACSGIRAAHAAAPTESLLSHRRYDEWRT